MATEDDRFDDRMDDGNNEPSGNDAIIAKARAKVSLPATLMILAAILMFVTSFGGIYLNFFSGLDITVEMLTYFEKNATDPRMKADFQKQLEEAKTRDKTAESVMNIFFTALGMIGNILVLITGLKMKALKGYGLCIAGSIFALILNGCCCVGIIPGIWSLVVLSNSEVKAGFDAMKRNRSF